MGNPIPERFNRTLLNRLETLDLPMNRHGNAKGSMYEQAHI